MIQEELKEYLVHEQPVAVTVLLCTVNKEKEKNKWIPYITATSCDQYATMTMAVKDSDYDSNILENELLLSSLVYMGNTLRTRVLYSHSAYKSASHNIAIPAPSFTHTRVSSSNITSDSNTNSIAKYDIIWASLIAICIIVSYIFILFACKYALEKINFIGKRRNLIISHKNLSNIEMVTYSQVHQLREEESIEDIISTNQYR